MGKKKQKKKWNILDESSALCCPPWVLWKLPVLAVHDLTKRVLVMTSGSKTERANIKLDKRKSMDAYGVRI